MSEDPRIGNWMQTYSGRKFWPLDPRPEEVFLVDIAHALGCTNRFGGHARIPYSVGDHSIRVAWEVYRRTGSAILALGGLLHDGSEAYCVDVPSPLKLYLPEYKAIEAKVMEAIRLRFGLPENFWHHPEVHRADRVLLLTEARDLMAPPPEPWGISDLQPLPETIVPRTWREAEEDFLRDFAHFSSLAQTVSP